MAFFSTKPKAFSLHYLSKCSLLIECPVFFPLWGRKNLQGNHLHILSFSTHLSSLKPFILWSQVSREATSLPPMYANINESLLTDFRNLCSLPVRAQVLALGRWHILCFLPPPCSCSFFILFGYWSLCGNTCWYSQIGLNSYSQESSIEIAVLFNQLKLQRNFL